MSSGVGDVAVLLRLDLGANEKEEVLIQTYKPNQITSREVGSISIMLFLVKKLPFGAWP